MWVAVTRAGCCVVAFGGSEKSRLVTVSARSDVPLLWRRLIVVASTRQWFRQSQSVEYPTKSQWGAAWSQLSRTAVLSSVFVPAWDPRHGSWPTGFKSGLFGGHRLGAMNSGVSCTCCSSWTVSRARWAGALFCWNTYVSPAIRLMWRLLWRISGATNWSKKLVRKRIVIRKKYSQSIRGD